MAELVMKRIPAITLVTLVLVGAVSFAVVPRVQHFLDVRKAEQILQHPLPPVTLPLSTVPNTNPNPSPNPTIEVNLPVPFTVQAPHGNWNLPYQEACEEAAAIMAIRYVFQTTFLDADDADAGILDLVRTNEQKLGYPVDQTVEQVQHLIRDVAPKIPVRLVRDPSIENLKQELSAGNVIIVPAAGRMLRNPFYRRPGPLYHMLVLRGYTSDGFFITNDPGTKRGEGYLYPYARIMEAMGDWNNGNPGEGEKVVLVVEPLRGGTVEM